MTKEQKQRAAVVAEAMTWLRTPYEHRGRVRGLQGCCDCAGLPLEVYAAVGIIPPTDVGDYSAQWHLHRSAEQYMEWVEKFGRRIVVEAVRPGDFMLFRFGRTFSHGGIVSDACGPRIIHAYVKARMVTIDDVALTHQLQSADKLAYTFWGRG